MFYYPTVLKHHTGCFSTIWLVATKGIRVPRRDFLKVNVKSTCDDIMNYVLERVPPPRPGLPRPRFSLYLSSQLQYGVIVVYHRQCAILLEELHTIVGQLVKQATSQKIDMDDYSRQSLLLPDALSLLEEAEGALDPLFGVMDSPSTLLQMGEEYQREASPELPELISPTAAAAAENGMTASPETITMRETEPVAMPVTEFEGEELIHQHPETIDFLLEQPDYFPEEDLEAQREKETRGEQERELERRGTEGDLEEERAKELTGSVNGLQPTTASSEEATLLPQEGPGLSVEKPEPPPDQLTPVSAPPLPSPPSAEREREIPIVALEDLPTPEERRRRQLIFFDSVTQIPQEVLQQQIDDPLTETSPPPFLPPPSDISLSATELLNNPCTFLPEEVLFLWRQAATITPVPGSDLQVGERGPESTDSEKEREREMAEAAEREEERLELSPKEVPKDLAEEEMFDISGMGTLPLEASDQREVSREMSPIDSSEREGSTVSRPVPALGDIPEVVDEALERALPEHEPAPAPVLFRSLLPPDVDRRTVSTTFQRLLENLSARKMCVEQSEPYGDILISLGPEYQEVQLTV
ncbi:meiotic recombination protein REC8 homolog [Lates calcarifer]|uniref:Meiotic recombination protein REC8 homolog n=1 Tax=Lates calcarifer TaxID=8187 RepID=A0AAJ8DV89_LATCA|nr:meiotic recombination protein REC8 homolog [Lates calcarifer]